MQVRCQVGNSGNVHEPAGAHARPMRVRFQVGSPAPASRRFELAAYEQTVGRCFGPMRLRFRRSRGCACGSRPRRSGNAYFALQAGCDRRCGADRGGGLRLARSHPGAGLEGAADDEAWSQVLKSSEDYYRLGRYYDGSQRWDKSIEAYEKALAIDSRNVEAYNALGVALSQCNRHDEAQAALRKALSIDDRQAHVWNNLGYVLLLAGNPREAIAALKTAVKLDSKNAIARQNLREAVTRWELAQQGGNGGGAELRASLDEPVVTALAPAKPQPVSGNQASDASQAAPVRSAGPAADAHASMPRSAVLDQRADDPVVAGRAGERDRCAGGRGAEDGIAAGFARIATCRRGAEKPARVEQRQRCQRHGGAPGQVACEPGRTHRSPDQSAPVRATTDCGRLPCGPRARRRADRAVATGRAASRSRAEARSARRCARRPRS